MLCTESTLHSFRDISHCLHSTQRMTLKGETFDGEKKDFDATDSIEIHKEKVKAAEEKIQEIVKSAEKMQAQVSKVEQEEIKNGNESNAKSEKFLGEPLGSATYAKEVQSAMEKMNTRLNEAKEKAKNAFHLATEANKKITEAKSALNAAEKESDNNEKIAKAAKAAKDAQNAQTEAEKANVTITEATNALRELKNEYKKLEMAFCKVTISDTAYVVYYLHKDIENNHLSAFTNNSRINFVLREIEIILKEMRNEEIIKTVQTQLEAVTKSQSTAAILYKNVSDTSKKAKEGKKKTTKFWNKITQYTSLEEVKKDCDEAEKILKELEDWKKSTESECIKLNKERKKVKTANDTAFTNLYADKVLTSIYYAAKYAQDANQKKRQEESDVKVIEALNKGEMGEYSDMMRHQFDLFQKLFSQLKQNADTVISASVNAENQREKAMKAVNDVFTATDAVAMEGHANDAKDASIAASLHEKDAFAHKIKMNNEYFDLFKTKNVIKITSSAIKAAFSLNKTKAYADHIHQIKNESDAAIKCLKEMSGAVQGEHQHQIRKHLKSAEDAFATVIQQEENVKDVFYKVQAEKNKIDTFVRGMQRDGTCPVTLSKLFNQTKIALSKIEKEEKKFNMAHENVLTSKEKIISAIEEGEKLMGVTHAKSINKMSPQQTKDSTSLKDSCAVFAPLTPVKEDEKSGDGNEVDGNETVETTRPVTNSDVMIHPCHALLFSLMVVLCTVLLNEA